MSFAAFVSLASTVAGSLLKAKGAKAEGVAGAREAAFRARVLRNNAARAEEAALETLEIGRTKQAFARIETRQLIGRQRVVLAANGVVVDTGSAADLQVDAAVRGDLNARLIAHGAEREAFSFRRQAEDFREEAGLLDAAGEDALAAGSAGAFGSFLEGAGLVASQWNGAFGDR